ncbi:MAG: response regulator [Actinomycetota bacterium]
MTEQSLDKPEKRRRAVIAEDEAIIRLDLKEMLEEEGFDVVGEAGDGATAVELARGLHPDLCIFDIKMPVMDGIEAATRLAEDRIAPVIILTAFGQRDLVERAREAGAMAYLVKPFQKSDLIPAIEMAVGRFAEMQALVEEVADLEERLTTRKAVDRARGLLMDRRSLGEHEAFRLIQRTAMNRRVGMRVIAEEIVAELSQAPGGSPEWS